MLGTQQSSYVFNYHFDPNRVAKNRTTVVNYKIRRSEIIFQLRVDFIYNKRHGHEYASLAWEHVGKRKST